MRLLISVNGLNGTLKNMIHDCESGYGDVMPEHDLTSHSGTRST